MSRSLFFRAGVRAYGVLLITIVFSAIAAFAADPAFIRGGKGSIRGLILNYDLESRTRGAMKIQEKCIRAKGRPTALAMQGLEDSMLVPHVKAQTGLVLLEGILSDGSRKPLDTELMGPYKNYPVSMPAEVNGKLKTRYPLAITFAAPFPPQGDIVIQKGDYIGLRTEGQLYAYPLPAFTLRKGGMLRLYLGTDDTLYYDAGLTHPLHEGKCKKPAK